MRTYFNINVFGRKLKLQRDKHGSIILGFYKDYLLPKLGREGLELLDKTLCNDTEKVRELIEPRFYRGQYNANDITIRAIENMAKIAATECAEDITTPIYTEKSMTEEEKEYWRKKLKEMEEEIRVNKVALESILQN
jgi:hypothetical protein